MTPLRQKGLSLIEVMIALAVFSFGLLALAALMASGLKYNTSALHRSYATSQAYDMADRMRANRLGLDTGYYNDLSESDTDPGCIETGCCPKEMAKYETWHLTPETSLDLEGYATVSAALAKGRDRSEVLARHELDEDDWVLEEQAWLSRLSEAVGSDDELVRRYNNLVKAKREPAKRRDG